MEFLKRVLDPPRYGFTRNGAFYRPTRREIFAEFGRRMNVLASRRNWLPLFGWVASASLAIPLAIFLTRYFSVGLMAVGFAYGMVAMGSHGTFWLHRYGTHRAFRFRAPWIAAICRNLVIRVIPEEIYILSHHVHHRFSEQPRDPYNVNGGWLYCFLADANHQMVATDLSPGDYQRVQGMMSHMGVRMNSYAQYRRWGSVCHPFWTIAHYALNWGAWYGIFYLVGGHALATAIFGWAGIWAFGVRTYNYDGHGRGKDKRQAGSDFNRADLSVNQIWPGYVAGEWHNNHHLYPNGARSGFLSYQLDLPWLLIRALSRVGAISSYRDYRADFLRTHHAPWKSGVPVDAPAAPSSATDDEVFAHPALGLDLDRVAPPLTK